MDSKDFVIVDLLMAMYYMMGMLDASDNVATYDIALEAMGKAERLVFGETF